MSIAHTMHIAKTFQKNSNGKKKKNHQKNLPHLNSLHILQAVYVEADVHKVFFSRLVKHSVFHVIFAFFLPKFSSTKDL